MVLEDDMAIVQLFFCEWFVLYDDSDNSSSFLGSRNLRAVASSFEFCRASNVPTGLSEEKIEQCENGNSNFFLHSNEKRSGFVAPCVCKWRATTERQLPAKVRRRTDAKLNLEIWMQKLENHRARGGEL